MIEASMPQSERPARRIRGRLSSPRFVSFFLVQGLGAANDNAFKIALSLFLLSHLPDEASQVRFASLAQFLFPLPFLLFSPLAGFLADRYGKGRMIFFTKFPEVLAMSLAIAAFGAGSSALLMTALFLMALQSAFFSPVKYGLLPESLESRDLSMGNGILQMTTNLSILLGTAAGVFIYERFDHRPEQIGVTLLCAALVGTVAALYVPRTPAGSPHARFEANPWRSFRTNWAEARSDPPLFQSLLGIAYFWLLGSLFLTIIPIFSRNVLGTSVRNSGFMLMILSLGIAGGSLLAGHLSRGRVELGLVPLGSLGLTLFTIDLAVFGETGVRWAGFPLRAGIDLLLLGLAAGLFIVPLNAMLQQRSPEGGKGRMIAFSNLLTFSAVLLASAIPWLTTDFLGWNSQRIVLAAGLTTGLVTLYIISLLPDFLVRLVLWLLANTVYRIHVSGDENLPRGGGLLVANHVSWVDALLVGAACDRRIRFLMYRPLYERLPFHWLFRRMGVIPVSAKDTAEQKEASLAIAREQIAQGRLVCIFAEGSITRTGYLLRFRSGLERIAGGGTAPIVPVLLDGVWGSIFSYRDGQLRFRWPDQFLAPVRVQFGHSMPSTTKAHEVRQRIQEMSVDAFTLRKKEQRQLQFRFLRQAKRSWRRRFLADSSGRELRYGPALVRVLALRSRLAGEDEDHGAVGILLPPGLEGAVANLAVLAAGRPVLNLTPETEPREVERQIAQAGVSSVLTSREISERFGWLNGSAPAGAGRSVPIHLVEEQPSAAQQVLLWAVCRFVPSWLLDRRVLSGDPRDVDATAALVPADLPTEVGDAPMVVLSHNNLLSNIESLRQVFRPSARDRILGALPFSNPFGLTHTLLLPAITGVPVAYVTDPSDGEAIGRLAARYRASLLPLTPEHLALCCDSVEPEQFQTLRYLVTSGDGLTPELRDRVVARFDIEPLAGFGCAECAPLISLNVPTEAHGRIVQRGHARGTSGHPLPGIAVRIVDRSSGAALPPGQAGLLRVRGPNVMRGYLADDRATARVLRDGWLLVDRIAVQDVNGFLTLPV